MAAGRPRQSQMQRRDAAHAWRMRVELHRVFSHDQSRAALQGAGSSPRPMVNSQDVASLERCDPAPGAVDSGETTGAQRSCVAGL